MIAVYTLEEEKRYTQVGMHILETLPISSRLSLLTEN
jgi:hypothetical protein